MTLLLILLLNLSLSASTIENDWSKQIVPFNELKYSDDPTIFKSVADHLKQNNVPIDVYVKDYTDKRIKKKLIKLTSRDMCDDILKKKEEHLIDPLSQLSLTFDNNVPSRVQNYFSKITEQRKIRGKIHVTFSRNHDCPADSKSKGTSLFDQTTININPKNYYCTHNDESFVLYCSQCRGDLINSINHELTHHNEGHLFMVAYLTRKANITEKIKVSEFSRSCETQAILAAFAYSSRYYLRNSVHRIAHYNREKGQYDTHPTGKKMAEDSYKILKIMEASRESAKGNSIDRFWQKISSYFSFNTAREMYYFSFICSTLLMMSSRFGEKLANNFPITTFMKSKAAAAA